MYSRRLSIALLITAVWLGVKSTETEEQSDTCVCVGAKVDFDHGRNSSELWCEAPEKPLNGGFVSETNGDRYNTGDTITYYCNRGHQLIGGVNRTCNGTSKRWEPEEPYCEPEYIGHLMRRLSGIEAEIKDLKQSIAAFENNTLQMGFNISVVDNRMSSIENNVSAIYSMELLNLQTDRKRLEACTNITKGINEDTLTKCRTMQLSERNGNSVSVYTWVIDDYKNKMPKSSSFPHYSQPFYLTVPGYKFRLIGHIYSDSDIYLWLQLLPGEYDDQLKWPFSRKHDVTVLTNDGLEIPHRTFSGDRSICYVNRPTSEAVFTCYTHAPNWDDVLKNRKHILSDGSVVVKLYFYN